MSASDVSTIEQNNSGQKWIQAFYDVLNVDTFDVESWFHKYFHSDATLTYNSGPRHTGYNEISAHMAEKRRQQSVRYTVKHVGVLADRIYVEVDATLIRRNDPERKEINLPELTVFYKKINENKVSSIKIYVDPTPLIETIERSS